MSAALDGAFEWFRERIIEHQEFIPMFILCKGTHQHTVIAAVFDDEPAKRAGLDFVAYLLDSDQSFTSYISAFEAWVANSDEMAPDVMRRIQANEMNVSDLDRKREIVIAFEVVRDGDVTTRSGEIVRGDDGKIASVNDKAIPSGMQFGGRFSELFTRKIPREFIGRAIGMAEVLGLPENEAIIRALQIAHGAAKK